MKIDSIPVFILFMHPLFSEILHNETKWTYIGYFTLTGSRCIPIELGLFEFDCYGNDIGVLSLGILHNSRHLKDWVYPPAVA